ncbi:MAG: hypothetical protein O2821_12940 [Chloroflexi bacterium]|nr:hypothetical protein [Chloroflexota bacterium]MDA1228488.1 hypothetical protein [Chloroflexota bacterium]
MKQDAPISRQLSGDLVITSNGGDRVLPITGNVLGVHSASLERLRTVKGLYRQGETMAMEYLVTNDGTVPLEYSAAVTLKGPDGRIVYDAMSAGENVRLSLEAEASQSVNFVWEIPLEEPVGFYEAYVALTYWFDPDLIFYDALNDTFMRATSKPLINQLFEVKEGPRLVVDPLEWDYGTVLVEQDTGSANFQITNSGGATLEWELVSWPDWIMIAKPTIFTNIGGGNILARVRPSLTPDDYSGAIRVESNGGDISLPISIRITSPSTPTPLPTATVEPTATPPPIAPTATPAPQSPTATPRANRPAPAPPTNTPVNATSTAVPANARPAATATPVLIALATVESTPGSSGVGCSVPLGNVSLASGLVNGLLLVAPLGLIAGARYGRRRSKHSSK